jgi:hypothetical protein
MIGGLRDRPIAQTNAATRPRNGNPLKYAPGIVHAELALDPRSLLDQ